MTVGICTLGCKVNLYESMYLTSRLREEGFEIRDFSEVCDVYIINTCTVTNNSDAKSRKMIHSAKAKNPKACLVVCGCFVESANRDKNSNFDFSICNVVVGNSNKDKIPMYIKEFFKTGKNIVDLEDVREASFTDMFINEASGKTRAFVKIQDGCENFCRYCIIPFVRGKCRSKAKDKVIFEITELVRRGYKEIVLTGIHTGNYGSDIGTNFASLLKEILIIPNLERVRISSIEITELDEEFFELLKNPKICNHLHIPLQSGSDKVLKLMNRKYDTKMFLNKIKRIRAIRPDISLTTDVIVGFPMEEDDDFLDCLKFIRKVNFSKVHVFPYSMRNGTKAAGMRQVDGKIKKERVQELLELSEDLERSYYESFIGKTEKVLIEKVEEGIAYGHTSNYLYLKLVGDYKENEIYEIKISKKNFNLFC